MVLSTCSPYFRSLFASVPAGQHPVLLLCGAGLTDPLLELLLRYCYCGQVSVTEAQLVPLVQAAKTLSIKGLLDVPVQTGSALLSHNQSRPTEAPEQKRRNVNPGQISESNYPIAIPFRNGESNFDESGENLDEEGGVDPGRSDIDQSVSFHKKYTFQKLLICSICCEDSPVR